MKKLATLKEFVAERRLMLFLYLTAIAAGAFFLWQTAAQTDRKMRDELLSRTRLAASMLNLDCIKSLAGSESDLESPAYLRIKEQLVAIRAAEANCRFSYLMGRRPDGLLFMYADSEAAGSKDESPPGQLYEEAAPEELQVFDAVVPLTMGPFDNRWGTWISAQVPLTDPQSGKLIAVFGMDIDVRDWKWNVAAQVAVPAGFMLMLLVVAFALSRSGTRLSSSGRTNAWIGQYFGVRGKTSLALGIILAALTTVLYFGSRNIIEDKFAHLELRDAKKDIDHVLLALAERRATLEATVQDWAYWDEAYAFAQDRNEAFVEENLTPASMTNLRIRMMALLAPSGHLICGGALNPKNPAEFLSAEDFTRIYGNFSYLPSVQNAPRARSGIVLTEDAPLLLAFAPILSSQRQGPAHGILIVGKALDEEQIEALAMSLKLNLTLYRADRLAGKLEQAKIMRELARDPDQSVRIRDEQILDAYGLVRDINGRPALLIKVSLARDIQREAKRTTVLVAALLTMAGTLVLLSVLWLLRKLVVKRLELLSENINSIARTEDFSRQLQCEGSDELDSVARDVNRLLEAVSMSRSKLVASEDRFCQLAAQSRTITWEVNPEGLYTFISPLAKDVLGYDPEELVGRFHFYDLHQEDGRDSFKAAFELFARKEPFQNLTSAARCKNGETCWLSTNGLPLLNPDGTLRGYRGSDTDITERKRAESESRRNMARRQRESDAVVALALSPNLAEGAVRELALELTETAARALEVERVGIWLFEDGETRLVNLDIFLASTGEHSSGTVLLSAQFQAEFDVLRNAKYVDAHDALTDPRTAGYVEGYLKPNNIRSMLDAVIRSRGRNLGLICFEHVDRLHHWEDDEITFACQIADQMALAIAHQERKKSEQALVEQTELQKMLMDISNDFINLALDKTDEAINSALAMLGQFTKTDRAYVFKYDHGRNICSNTHEWCGEGITPQIGSLQEVPISAIPDWANAHFAGEAIHIPDISDLAPDSGIRRILEPQGIQSLLALPMMDGDACVGFVGFDAVKCRHSFSEKEKKLLNLFALMLVNTFNRNIVQTELTHAKEKAEAASRAKGEFLANMSHEIRTPLNGVIGFTDLLRNTPLTPVQQQYLNNANVSGHALLGIINNILDFSKIEAGMMELEMIKTDMVELFENSVDIVKFSAGKKNLEILLDMDSAMPRFAMLDPVRLKQVLANLLGNAVKFTEKGEVELKVRYSPIGSGRGKFSISVRDTGIGITDAQKERLFKAFSQADSSTTRKFGGTGLGLIISEMIIQKMGSGIQIVSSPGNGSNFSFELSACTEAGDARSHADISHVKHCLIIDDNANNRLILEHMLAGWGLESASCGNGVAALEILESPVHFDLVICDYNMPSMDGLECIRLIREKLKLTPEKQPLILLHSSSDDAELHRKCDDLGVRFCISKPVKQEQLFACLATLHKPAKDNLSAGQTATPTPTADTAAIGKPEGRHLILVAEDVHMNMLLVKSLLSKLSKESVIVEAENGRVAVQKYREFSPDLVLMDVQMPELDGQEATKEIRELEKDSGRHVPIVALTAGALKEEMERCYSAGMDDFMTKPIEAKKLKELLDKYSRSRRSSISR